MLDTDQLRSFLAIVNSGSFTKAAERVHKTQSAVSMHIRRLEEQLGCALFVKHGRGARLTDEGERLIEFARRIVQVEAGALAALSRKGLRGAARLGIPDDYAEIVPGRNPRPLQSPPSAGRGLGRLRGVDRACSAGRRRGARSRAGHRLRGAEGARASARGAAGLGRRRTVPGRGGRADPACARQRDLLLAARDRAGADRGAGRDAGALLLQELQRDRHAPARRARGDDPARCRWSARASSVLGRAEGPAGTALEPHGPHPRAGTSERGSQGARRSDPRDGRRRGAPGRLSAREPPR